MKNQIKSMNKSQNRQLKTKLKCLVNNVVVQLILASVFMYAVLIMIEKTN